MPVPHQVQVTNVGVQAACDDQSIQVVKQQRIAKTQ